MMDISYTVVEPSQFQKAVFFYCNHFLPYDPTFQLLECYKQPSAKLDTRLLHRLEENLSWRAIDNTTGELVGLRVSHGVTIEEVPERMPTYEEYIESGWSREFSLVWLQEDAVFNQKEILEEHQETKLLKLSGLGVHMDYRNN